MFKPINKVYRSFLTAKRNLGFSLIELMAVVVILGILAAVAMPSFQKYVRKSKSMEARINVRAIYDLEVVYYSSRRGEHVKQDGSLDSTSLVFMPCSSAPSIVPGVNPYLVEWSSLADWNILGFTSDSPVLYQYHVDVVGTEAAVIARGDLDGDGITSQFQRNIYVDPSSGDLKGWPALRVDNEWE